MSSSTIIFLLIVSVVMTTYGRTLTGPDQLIPLLLSSVNNNENSINPSLNGQHRLKHFVENIIKYVSKIQSAENFIDNIVDHQKEVADKIKVLTFLNKCFELTHAMIQKEINHMSRLPEAIKKSSSSSSFTLEELQQAQSKVSNLLAIINERMVTLRAWIPPTMPFLGFF